MKKLAVILFAALFVFSCAQKGADKVVAKIGSTTITKAYLEKELSVLPPQAQSMFQNEQGLNRLVDEIVKREILYQEAKNKGLDKDPKLPLKLENTKKALIIGELLEKEVDSKVSVSEKDVKDFYEQNKAVLKDREGRPIPFEKLKMVLAENVAKKKQNDLFEAYVEGLKKNYKVEVMKDAIAEISKKPEQKKEEPKKEVTKEPAKEAPKK